MKPPSLLRRMFASRYWWILPLLFLLLPLVLVLYFLWSTPNYADFEYKIF